MRSRTSTTDARAALAAAALLMLVMLAGCGPAAESPRPAAFDPDSIPDVFARPAAALFEAGTTRGVLVNDRGALDDGVVTLALEPAGSGVPAPPPRRIAFEDRWRPIAHWRREAGGVRFDFEAVAERHAAPCDTALWVSVHVTATNTGAGVARAVLVATLDAPEQRVAFVAFDRDSDETSPVFAGRGGSRVRAWSAAGGEGPRSRWEQTLAPGGSAATRVVVCSYPRPAGEFAAWARVPHERRVADARRAWDATIARAARFELGDPEVEHALRAAWVVLLSCRERRGDDWVPIGGPFHYRDVWLRDGARAVSALAVSGYSDEALQLARGLKRLQWSDGSMMSQRGQLDGLGQGPWAYAQAALRRGRDASGVDDLSESAMRVWRYRQTMRAFASQSGWPLATMLPTAEPRDAELTRAQLVGNDAWALAGSRATARLLRAAGRVASAESVEATLGRDAQEFRDALARTGRADVPPSWQVRGLDWGNLAVGWPCAALPPRDPHLEVLARRVWAWSSEPGLAAYGGRDSLHAYLGADLGTWALLAGRPDDAARVLDALLRWRNASGAGAELVMGPARDYVNNLPPHPTTAAALVALVRNSLLYDDDDTLRVALGAREAWWRGAHVRGAPTRWGALDLELKLANGEAFVRWGSVPVWTEVTLPPHTVAADVAPPLVPARDGRAVLAPPGTAEVRVRVRPAGAPR